MLPRMVISIPSILLALLRINTRPKNSPTRFGMKVLTAIPDNTDEKDLRNGTFSIFPIRNFHFMDSIPQFTITRRSTIQSCTFTPGFSNRSEKTVAISRRFVL